MKLVLILITVYSLTSSVFAGEKIEDKDMSFDSNMVMLKDKEIDKGGRMCTPYPRCVFEGFGLTDGNLNHKKLSQQN